MIKLFGVNRIAGLQPTKPRSILTGIRGFLRHLAPISHLIHLGIAGGTSMQISGFPGFLVGSQRKYSGFSP